MPGSGAAFIPLAASNSFGSAKLFGSPPKVFPIREYKGVNCAVGRVEPSHKAQPTGVKLKGNALIVPIKTSISMLTPALLFIKVKTSKYYCLDGKIPSIAI